LDGAINFWHFLAKMKAGGMRELISVSDAALALGLDPETPLLGYVMKESFLAEHPELGQALYQASRASKDLLASDDAAWEAIRPIMNAKSDAQFEQLRTDFRAGIPQPGPVDEAGADKLLQLMAELGGEKLVGEATTLPAGLFLQVE
ncbi:MAG: ABC transporter substrate-binding protein, partial [Mangrovicoccus sp.]